jgi:BirA family transcriptional regulator, biotin operon repressor / biotin---[acetyl-CoA-carboxylase] ligase
VIEKLRSALAAPSGPYAALDLVSSTGSTNADLAAAVDAADRTVLIALEQTAGRGRRSREWVSPASGLYLSVLLRPASVPASRLGTLAMVAGLALAGTAREVAAVDAALKWPNDLLAGSSGGKCAGVLSEVVAGGVIVGIGLNVAPLPVAVPAGVGGLQATSLAEEGAVTTDLAELAIALLGRFATFESSWRAAAGDVEVSGILASYKENCATLGKSVRVELPDGELRGEALDITTTGELVIKTEEGAEVAVSAGDVVHIR